jgi:hypothetical protein
MEAEPLTHHFDVRDINNLGFKSTRTVCPLKPEYRINGMVIRDDPRYTEPKPLPGPSNHDFFCLKTDDIEGAAPGWVPPHECRPAKEDRKHFRNTNFVGDIPGAQADTVKHAIRTERVVNPLNPVYDSLDGDRLRPPMTPNTLNGDPAKFGLSQPDSFKDAASNSRKQTPTSHKSVVDDVNVYEVSQPEVSSSARDEFVPPSSSRVPQMRIAEMNQTKDEKIASLERELTRLRSVSQGGGGGGGGIMSSRDSKQRSATMSASNFVASARSSNGNTQLVSTGRMPTERFTLRSGDNSANASARRPQPNFSKTGGKSRNTTARSSANMVSSRRESAALAAEIASVRDL